VAHEPKLWICGGGLGVPARYGYGYWTGPDGDLLCVVNNVNYANYAEYALSPIFRFKWWAYLQFVLKRRQLLSNSVCVLHICGGLDRP